MIKKEKIGFGDVNTRTAPIELKPCPFCGGEAEILEYGKKSVIQVRICCTTEDCTAWETCLFDSYDKAATAWNHRHYLEGHRMTNEQLNAIRARYKATNGLLHDDIFELLTALKDSEAERIHYKEMFEAVVKKGAQVEAERDHWKKVWAEARERAIKSLGGGCACVLCKHVDCDDCESLNSWQFDEARFTSMPEVSS